MSLLRFSNTFLFAGTLADETIFGSFVADVACSITQIQLSCQTAPVGSAVTIDLIDDLDAETGSIATLADGSDSQVTDLGTALELAVGDSIRAKIKSVGSSTPGEFLVVTLVGTYTPTDVPVDVPEDVAVCTLYGFQYINGLPSEGTRVSIKLNNVPVASAVTVFEDSPQHVDTDEDGRWEMDLIQGQNYLLTIWKAGILNQSIVIPEQSSCNVASLI